MILDDILTATWPPAEVERFGAVTLRRGAGGGSRLSAATVNGPLTLDEIKAAEDRMRAWEQVPRWRIAEDDPMQAALDAQLGQMGYVTDSPTVLMCAEVADIAALDLPLMSAFRCWPPLAVQRELWAAGGIGPSRLAVMARATGPKTTLLGRVGHAPAGTAFVAMHEDGAMLHALEVSPNFRRRGLARNMVVAAAKWAAEQDARTFALLVTKANTGARALYEGLGFDTRPAYHYRLLQEETYDTTPP